MWPPFGSFMDLPSMLRLRGRVHFIVWCHLTSCHPHTIILTDIIVECITYVWNPPSLHTCPITHATCSSPDPHHKHAIHLMVIDHTPRRCDGCKGHYFTQSISKYRSLIQMRIPIENRMHVKMLHLRGRAHCIVSCHLTSWHPHMSHTIVITNIIVEYVVPFSIVPLLTCKPFDITNICYKRVLDCCELIWIASYECAPVGCFNEWLSRVRIEGVCVFKIYGRGRLEGLVNDSLELA